MKIICAFLSLFIWPLIIQAQSSMEVKVRLSNYNYEIQGELIYKSSSPCPEDGIHLCMALQDTLVVFSDSDVFFEDRRLGTIENWEYIIDSLLLNGYGIHFDGIIDPEELPLHGAIIGKKNKLLYMREIDYPKTFSLYKAILTAPDLSLAQMRVGMSINFLFTNIPLNNNYHKIVIIRSCDIEKVSIPSFSILNKQKNGNLYYGLPCIMLTAHNGIITKIEFGHTGYKRSCIFTMYDDIATWTPVNVGYITDSMRELSHSIAP